jgi:hypothetical protein
LAVTAFFDITGRHGRLYVFEEGVLRDNIPFELSEDRRFFTGDLPEDIGEALVSLPLEMLDFRMLELPFSEPARVREVLPFELDGLILGGTEGVVVDALVLKEPEGEKHRVLAVFVEREKIRALLGRLSELGLDPRAITSVELAHAVKISTETGELGRMLLEPSALAEPDRPAAAHAELSDLTINLRRGDFAYTRDIEKTRRSMMFTVLALILLLLILAGDLGLRTLKLGKQAAGLESQIVSLYSGMFPGEKPESARGLAYKAKALLKEARGKEQGIRRAQGRGPDTERRAEGEGSAGGFPLRGEDIRDRPVCEGKGVLHHHRRGEGTVNRAMLAIGGGVLAALIILAVLIGLHSSAKGRLKSYRAARNELLMLRDGYLSLKGKIDALERKRNLTRVQGIIQAVDQVAVPLGLKDKVKSVKPLGSDSPGEEKAEVTLQAVNMNEMANFLYAIENSPMLLLIRKISLKTSFEDPEMLNMSMTLSLMKPE